MIKTVRTLVLLVLAIILIGCEKMPANIIQAEAKISFPLVKTIEVIIAKKINDMTIEEKIAQMLIISLPDRNYNNKLEELITNFQPGGIILSTGNFYAKDQTSALITAMQAASEITMFIAVDQEGGSVQRLKKLKGMAITTIPTMAVVGKKNDAEYAYKIGKTIGEELFSLGINMDFAPSLDIVSNPKNQAIGDRSFGNNSKLVWEMGAQVARGIRDSGGIAVFKHFPGHGSTSDDSHTTLPVVNKTKAELFASDLQPFIWAIEDEAEVIMIAHVSFPAVSGDKTPASLSTIIITDLLRGELGFNGIVITDALNMSALTKHYSKKQIIVKALQAGNDILLMPGNIASTITIIKGALDNGEIPLASIDEAVKRILWLKYKKGMLNLSYTK